MVDEQTKRSIETMCRCGLDLEGLKGCFPKIDETDLTRIHNEIKGIKDIDGCEPPTISCNCS